MNNCRFLAKWSLALICPLIFLTVSCEKDPVTSKLPTLNSSDVFSISSNAVTFKSSFELDKDTAITILGICWSSRPDPKVYRNFTAGSLIDSIMYTRIEGLAPNTKYYAKVYVNNSKEEMYGDEIEFTTNSMATDVEGNLYNTVTLGSQIWMAENLRATKYKNGSDIQMVTKSMNWDEFDSPGYGWYDYKIENKGLYGALYNWPVVNSGELCPAGWHVPTDAEWGILSDYAGVFLQSTINCWTFIASEATNYSGFCGLPGGSSSPVLGSFTGKGMWGDWWSSTIDNTSYANDTRIITRRLSNWGELGQNSISTRVSTTNFQSIRCIKN